MTLRRKNLAPQGLIVSIYGMLLTAGLILGVYDDFHHVHVGFVVGTIGNVAAILRLGVGMSKYLLWVLLGLATLLIRCHSESEMRNSFGWAKVFVYSMIGMVWVIGQKLN